METVKGQVVSVTRGLAGSNLIVDAVATDTELFLDDVADFDEEGGSVTVDGDVLTYIAVDQEASSITLSAGLAGGLTAYETFVAIYPDAPTHVAEVLLTDDSGVTVSALVPQNLRALLHEGIRDPEVREAVTLMNNGDDWMVLDIEWQAGTHDASTVPIVVSNVEGESAQMDADGFSTYTNDPVPIRTIVTSSTGHFLAASDGYVYAGVNIVRKFNASTGAEVLSGFPISSTSSVLRIAADSGFLYLTDGTADVRKFNASTGAEVLSGFPIVGTFSFVAASAGFVYATGSGIVRKYDAATGVEDTGGDFPLSLPGGVSTDIAVAAGFLYALDGNDLHKYDAATGVEDTGGDFPVTGPFSAVAAGDEYVFVSDDVFDIRKFNAETGEEQTTGYPLGGPLYPVAYDDGRIFAPSDTDGNIRIFNAADNYQSTLRNSSDGSDRAHTLTVSNLTSTGDATFEGTLSHTPTFTDVTFNGSWTNFGSPYEEVSYALSAGHVYLRGAAKHATTSTTGTVFTLPVGYRPTKQRRFTVGAGATGGIALFTVNSSGVVSIAAYASGGSAAIVEFDLISFDVSP